MATSKSKKSDLLSKKMALYCGDKYINTVYNTFKENIRTYFSGREEEISSGSKKIFRTTFSGQLSTLVSDSEINGLVNNSNPFNNTDPEFEIFNNPYVFWILSDSTDNQLTNILTTGVLTATEPTQTSKDEISNATGFGTNYNAAIKAIRDHQFSCRFKYPNYKNNKATEVDFSLTLNPSTTGSVLGLVIFVDDQKLNKNDSLVVEGLIISYSNLVNSVFLSSYGASAQKIAISNSNIFKSNFDKSVDRYLIESDKNESVRSGATNAPVSADKRPKLTDENFIIKNKDDLVDPTAVNPETITLNQFTEPKFESARSILDVIRGNTTDDEIIESGVQKDITIDGNIEEQKLITEQFGAKLSGETDEANFDTVLTIMNQTEKNTAITEIKAKIKQFEEEAETLVAQKNSIIKTDEFLLTAIICVSAPGGDTYKTWKQTKNKKAELTVESLSKYYVELSRSLENEDALNDKSFSSYAKAQSSQWKDIQDLNPEFLKRLDIINRTPEARISDKTITDVYEKTKNNPPPEFNRAVSLVNKSNTPNTNKQIKSIAQSIISKVRATESKRKAIETNIKTLNEDLGKFQNG